MKTYLGIDIGGTKIAGAVVDEAGRVRHRLDIPTQAHLGGRQVLATSLDLAAALLALPYSKGVSAIGVGAGGQIDSERGIVISATDILPGWQGIAIKAEFEQRFRLTAAVDNDVNALASGELRFGAARGCKTAVFLALGTGVGGALVIDGKIHHGAHWTGGELGHMFLTMDADARVDPGGARGTLEAYCSGPALVETWRELTQNYTVHITAREVADMASDDPDGKAGLAIQKTGEYLGFGLAGIVNIVDPEIIVVGGGLASLGELLLQPARTVMSVHALPGPAECAINISTLGADASIIGAASMSMNSIP